MSVTTQIVYSRRYDIGLLGLERLHPFDSRKYGRAYQLLRRKFGRDLHERVSSPTSAVSIADLLTVHTEAYLARLKDSVARNAKIGLAIYNAGTDIYTGDTLGGLSVSADGVLRRDQFVIRELVNHGIPTVMLLSGGYRSESYRLVANSVQWMLETWN